MSGDVSYIHSEMATNDFVNDFKSLSLSQTEYSYSITIQRLIIQLNQATPNGLRNNRQFFMALVDNCYRIIPIFDKKLSEDSDNSRQTNLFLQTFAGKFVGLCMLDLFLAVQDSNCVEFIFQKYIPLLKQDYFTDENIYDNLINCLLSIIVYSCALIQDTEDNLPGNLLSILLEFVKNSWQCETRETLLHNTFSFMKVFSKSPAIVPMIIRSEWPHACIE